MIPEQRLGGGERRSHAVTYGMSVPGRGSSKSPHLEQEQARCLMGGARRLV